MDLNALVADIQNYVANNTHEIIVTVVVGAIAGWLAGYIVQGKGFGFFQNIIVGILGAFVGNYIFDLTGTTFNAGTVDLNKIITAVIGALILLILLRLFKKK